MSKAKSAWLRETEPQKIERDIARRAEESRKLAAFDDLVKACEKMLHAFDKWPGTKLEDLDDSQLRAAIAKARG